MISNKTYSIFIFICFSSLLLGMQKSRITAEELEELATGFTAARNSPSAPSFQDAGVSESEARDQRRNSREHIAAAVLQPVVVNGSLEADNEEGWTALHRAARYDQAAEVEKFLRAGIKIESEDSKGRTPLFLAAQYGASESIKALLACKASIKVKDDEHGATPLHIAAKNGHDSVVQLLLGEGADVDAVDKDGNTSLHLAGNRESVRLLLKYNAELHAKNKHGITPFYSALKTGNKDTVKYFIEECGIDPQKGDGASGAPILYSSSPEIFKMLFARGVQIARLAVATSENCALMKFIFEEDIQFEVSSSIDSLLKQAIMASSINMVKLLLEKGASLSSVDKEFYNFTPLHYAAYRARLEIARFLIERGADTKAKSAPFPFKKKTPLQVAKEQLAEERDAKRIAEYKQLIAFLKEVKKRK